MIKRHPLQAARRNPTYAANPARKNPFRLLKNPMNIEIAGDVKVLPLIGGAALAIGVSQIYRNIPMLNNIGVGADGTPSALARLLPGLAAVAVGWGLHKGLKHPLATQAGTVLAAAGVVLAVNDAAGTTIGNLVNTAAQKFKPAQAAQAPAAAAPAAAQAAAPAAGASGLRGGGFVPQLAGGQFNSFNKAFTPIEGTALSGFVMNGPAHAVPPVGLGARVAGRIGGLSGLDLHDFAD